MHEINRDEHIKNIHIPSQITLGILCPEECGNIDIGHSTHQILKKISTLLTETHHSFKLISTFDKQQYLSAAEEVLSWKSELTDTPVLEIVLFISRKFLDEMSSNYKLNDISQDKKLYNNIFFENFSTEIRNMVLKRLNGIKVDGGQKFKVIVSLTALVKSGIIGRRIMELNIEKTHDNLKIINTNHFVEELEKNSDIKSEYSGLKNFYDDIKDDTINSENSTKIEEKIQEYLVNNTTIFIFISEDDLDSSEWFLKEIYDNHWINPKSGCITKELEGTSIYKYIKKVGRTTYWINSKTGRIKEEKSKDNSKRSLEHLNIFNKEYLNTKNIEKKKEDCKNKFSCESGKNKFPHEYLEPIENYMIPYVVKSSLLADIYQKRDRWTNDAIYFLSILAVFVVTVQLLFSPNNIFLIILEVIFITIIFVILLASRKYDWHRKWIEYRFLSESLRSFPYMFLVEIDCVINNMLPHLSLSREDWVERAFEYITGQFKFEECRLSFEDRKVLFEPLKNFILDSWIKTQRKFYQNTCTRNKRYHKFFYYLSLIIFGLTLIFAVIDVILIYMPTGSNSWLYIVH